MKRVILFATIILSISGCGDSRSFEQRKNRLMFDCQCEPGTYEYSYKLANLLIEEQNAARDYIKQHKSELLGCIGMTDKNYELILNKIDDDIEFNKKARPYYITKLFFGGSQVSDITSYKQAKLDLFIKDIERSCQKNEKQ